MQKETALTRKKANPGFLIRPAIMCIILCWTLFSGSTQLNSDVDIIINNKSPENPADKDFMKPERRDYHELSQGHITMLK